MKIIKADLNNPSADVLEEIVSVIRSGGCVVHPTDTVYGLAANALDKKAVNSVFRIKGRDLKKPISIVARDIEVAKKLSFIKKEHEKMLKEIWFSPVTVVFERRESSPDFLAEGSKTIGFRMPSYPFIQKLISRLDLPLTATSANISGEPPAYSAQEVVEMFDKFSCQPDLVVDGGKLDGSAPSTVIDLSGQKMRVLRVGPVDREYLEKLLSQF